MVDRSNHYEKAFESHLRRLRIPFVGVDESRRAFVGLDTVKSLDFVVTFPHGKTLLIDVKGRKLATEQSRSLENWVTQDDVASLAHWKSAFGVEAQALFVFVYQLAAEDQKAQFADHFSHADRNYGCLAVGLEDYSENMRARSAKWKTVHLLQRDFRRLAKPFSAWL